jgi:bacteriorhodopsin
MITAGYMGAVSVVTTVKWFWFLFGMAMFLPVTSLNPRA